MRRLYICYSYYQLMVVVFLVKNKGEADESDVMIVDDGDSYKRIAYNLSKTKLFDNVKIWTRINSRIKDNRKIDKIKLFFKLNFGNPKRVLSIDDNLPPRVNYDEVLYYDKDVLYFALADYLRKSNKSVRFSRFEEGVLSSEAHDDNLYIKKGGVYYYTKLIRRIMHRFDYEINNAFYSLCPEFYEQSVMKIETSPKLIDECIPILDAIYEYNHKDYSKYKYLFIGRTVGNAEVEIAKKISNIVGNENMAIKLHPRDRSGRFMDTGFNVITEFHVPFELICLHERNNFHILLMGFSGSVLNLEACFGVVYPTYVLWPLVRDVEWLDEVYESIFYPFVIKNKNKNLFKSVLIINSFEMLHSKLNEYN